MSKRNQKQKSVKFVAFNWACAFLSVGLLYLTGKMLVSNFGQFRSCNSNNTNLYINSCGKQSFNFGDLLIIVLFVLAACLVVSLFTASWRLVRKEK